MVAGASNLKTSFDVYLWDQKQAPDHEKFAEGLDLLASTVSTYYTVAKTDYVAITSFAAELHAWHRLRELDKANAVCSTEAKYLSIRMEDRMRENRCLESCLDRPADGCVDRRRGKSRLAVVPPPPP